MGIWDVLLIVGGVVAMNPWTDFAQLEGWARVLVSLSLAVISGFIIILCLLGARLARKTADPIPMNIRD